MEIKRRSFLLGLRSLFAAPAIVKAENIMKIVSFKPEGPKPYEVTSGWLECNGALVNSQSYPELFAAIGKTFGGGLTASFNLPDLRGVRRPFDGRRVTHAIATHGGNGFFAGQIVMMLARGAPNEQSPVKPLFGFHDATKPYLEELKVA